MRSEVLPSKEPGELTVDKSKQEQQPLYKLSRIQQTVFQIVPSVMSRLEELKENKCLGSAIKTKQDTNLDLEAILILGLPAYRICD